jgi:hypothetical protein
MQFFESLLVDEVWVILKVSFNSRACKRCAEGVLEDCYRPSCISVDGVERGVMSLNRQIPGPAIHVSNFPLSSFTFRLTTFLFIKGLQR